MKTFKETINTNPEYSFKHLNENEFIEFSLNERMQIDNVIDQLQGQDLENIDEGLLGTLFGGLSGFLVGPTIGKLIARVLGIEKGLLYNLLTSKVVNTALGAELGTYLSSKTSTTPLKDPNN